MNLRRARFVTLFVGIAAIAGAPDRDAGAQPAAQEPSMKGAVIKGKAPVSNDVLKITLPRPAEFDMPNGLHVMVLQDARLPRVTFQLQVLGAGAYYDPPGASGLADFTASMLREGTKTRSSSEIARELEIKAASLTVQTASGSQAAVMNGSALTEEFPALFDIASDVLLSPAFAPPELDRFKARTRASLTQQRSQPNFLVNEMFSKLVYGEHPAARVSPTPDWVDRVTPEALTEFHRAHWIPDFSVLAISGDITPADARKLVETRLGSWTKAGSPKPVVANPRDAAQGGVSLVSRSPSVQTNFIVGAIAIERTNPDYDALAVMNRVVGGGPTGRLFLNLREDKGYTYGASSTFAALGYRGAWRAATEVRTDVTEPALGELMGELRRIRDEPVPARELLDAKRAMVAGFALTLESPPAILGLYVTRWTYNLPADYWDKYADRVMAVTAEQVQTVARKYLDPGRLRIVAVGEPKTAESLKKFGKLDVFDTEGKPVSP